MFVIAPAIFKKCSKNFVAMSSYTGLCRASSRAMRIRFSEYIAIQLVLAAVMSRAAAMWRIERDVAVSWFPVHTHSIQYEVAAPTRRDRVKDGPGVVPKNTVGHFPLGRGFQVICDDDRFS